MRVHVVTTGRIPRTGAAPRIGAALGFITDHFLLFPLAAACALVWANSRPESYFSFARAAAFLVNDVGMAWFLAYIAQMIWEELMPGGSLHTWRRWMLPMTAAIGGIGGSALTYMLYVNWQHEEMLTLGWPAATAIDLAFVFLAGRLIFRRHPAVSFLLLTAIASNVVAFLAVTPRFHLIQSRPGGAALIIAAFAVAALLRLKGVTSFVPYLFGAGTLAWSAFYLEGLQPALALIPIVPFLPHQPRGRDMFSDKPHGPTDAASRAEHLWRYPMQVILVMFALVNAGLTLTNYGTGTWALLTAALAGRPLGILAGVGVGVALGLRLPSQVHFRDLVVIAGASSAGFSMALFFLSSAYPMGPVLGELKLGALGTFAGLILAVVVAAILRVGRFSRGHQ